MGTVDGELVPYCGPVRRHGAAGGAVRRDPVVGMAETEACRRPPQARLGRLSDAWEIGRGLDPLSADGDDGRYGDPVHFKV